MAWGQQGGDSQWGMKQPTIMKANKPHQWASDCLFCFAVQSPLQPFRRQITQLLIISKQHAKQHWGDGGPSRGPLTTTLHCGRCINISKYDVVRFNCRIKWGTVLGRMRFIAQFWKELCSIRAVLVYDVRFATRFIQKYVLYQYFLNCLCGTPKVGYKSHRGVLCNTEPTLI